MADQLNRALGSISADLSEGFSRGMGNDPARFYEYAPGSARESRDWYYKGRHLPGEAVVQHRLLLMTRIIRLLLAMVPQQRARGIARHGRMLRDHHFPYRTPPDIAPDDGNTFPQGDAPLLHHIPLPTR